VRVYWPDTKTITVERNTYYDNSSASHLEGEQTIELTTNEMSTDSSTPEVTPDKIVPVEVETQAEENEETVKHLQKPSQRV